MNAERRPVVGTGAHEVGGTLEAILTAGTVTTPDAATAAASAVRSAGRRLLSVADALDADRLDLPGAAELVGTAVADVVRALGRVAR